jgi:hypothetical protein
LKVRVVVKVVAKAVVVEGAEEVDVVVVAIVIVVVAIVIVAIAAENVEATVVDAVEIVSTDIARPVKRKPFPPNPLSQIYTHPN